MSTHGVTYQGSGTLYAILRLESAGTVWNGTAFAAWADGSIGTYDIPLTSQGGDWYSFDLPTTGATGNIRILFYEQAGASPATDDLLLDSVLVDPSGNVVTSAASGSYLTSLARVKQYLGISSDDTSKDSYLTNLLSAASRFIEKYCDTKFIAASYTEYLNGTGTPFLELNNRPLTAPPTRIAVCPTDVLTVSNTSGSVQRAYVSLNSTGLTLVHTASATTTTNTLAFATYTTLDSLVTAIELLGSGWEASCGSYGSYPSADLRATQYANAIGGAGLEMYVEELNCNRIDGDNAIIYGYFPFGWRNIEVKYSAGYATIPDDVQQACVALTAGLYNTASSSGGTVKREKIGDYEIENFPTTTVSSGNLRTLSLDAFFLLQPYKRIPAL